MFFLKIYLDDGIKIKLKTKYNIKAFKRLLNWTGYGLN